MPTHSEEERFWQDWAKLTEEQQIAFAAAVEKIVQDLKAKRGFRKGLRIKGIQGHTHLYEMTWAPNGRATFRYGPSPCTGDVHLIWRRIGTHDILKNP